MASRWRSAFIALVFLFIGSLGMAGIVIDLSSPLEEWIAIGSLSVHSWKVYVIFVVLGFMMSGYALSGILRRQTLDPDMVHHRTEVDELEEEVEEAIFQLET